MSMIRAGGSSGGGGGGDIEGKDHELLGNRLGKDPVTGNAWHLTDDEKAGLEPLLSNRPMKPTNLYPYDEQEEVYQFPEFIGSPYIQPQGVAMKSISIEIATDIAFSNIVYSAEILTSQTVEPRISPSGFYDVIQPDTTYHWRIKYTDDSGRSSDWSEPTWFKTELAFGAPPILAQPNITYPQPDGKVAPVGVVGSTSAFRPIVGTDSHRATDWILENSNGDELWSSMNDTVNLTAIIIPIPLSGGDNFYLKARHWGVTAAQPSPYSYRRRFGVKEYYNDLSIGIAIRKLSDVYTIRYIDPEGNSVQLEDGYIDNHPLINGTPITIAGQEMLMFPETYVKCERDVGGDTLRYHISPSPRDGYYLDPMFRVSNGPVYIGKYLSGSPTAGGQITAQANSVAEYYPGRVNNNAAITTVPAHANWLNTGEDGEHRGWHVMSVYEYAFIRRMMLFDFRSFIFSDFVSGTVAMGTLNNDPAQPAWRGMANPWIGSFSGGPTSTHHAMLASGAINGITDGAGYRIGITDDLSVGAWIPLQNGAKLNGNVAYNAGTILAGWNDDLQCDLELLLLLDVTGGETKSKIVTCNTQPATVGTQSIQHCLQVRYTGAAAAPTGAITAGIGTVTAPSGSTIPTIAMRIAKWTQ